MKDYEQVGDKDMVTFGAEGQGRDVVWDTMRQPDSPFPGIFSLGSFEKVWLVFSPAWVEIRPARGRGYRLKALQNIFQSFDLATSQSSVLLLTVSQSSCKAASEGNKHAGYDSLRVQRDEPWTNYARVALSTDGVLGVQTYKDQQDSMIKFEFKAAKQYLEIGFMGIVFNNS